MRHKGCLTDFLVETKMNFESFCMCTATLFVESTSNLQFAPKKSQRLAKLAFALKITDYAMIGTESRGWQRIAPSTHLSSDQNPQIVTFH